MAPTNMVDSNILKTNLSNTTSVCSSMSVKWAELCVFYVVLLNHLTPKCNQLCLFCSANVCFVRVSLKPVPMRHFANTDKQTDRHRLYYTTEKQL